MTRAAREANNMKRPVPKPNGKFWCWHRWKPTGSIPPNSYETLGAYIWSECAKCGKEKNVSVQHFDEIPDELIDDKLRWG